MRFNAFWFVQNQSIDERLRIGFAANWNTKVNGSLKTENCSSWKFKILETGFTLQLSPTSFLMQSFVLGRVWKGLMLSNNYIGAVYRFFTL